MTTFNTFWKIVKKYKGTIILYTVILIAFGGINIKNNDITKTFESELPDIAIVNKDENKSLTNNLINYLDKNTKIRNIEEKDLEDALFYRDISYIIYIPENYTNDLLNNKNPEINIKTNNNYDASLSELILTRYLKVQNIMLKQSTNENEIINNINEVLETQVNVNLTSKQNISNIEKTATYFNFASYSITAVVIFIICLVLSSFHQKEVNKRIIISSTNYKKNNKLILIASTLFASIVCAFYIILGLILLKEPLLNIKGILYIINTTIFTFTTLTLALLISNLIYNKNAITALVNVISLSQAFLCGAFIPAKYMPDKVLQVAQILPARWYIKSNDILKSLETITLNNTNEIIINMIVMLIFAIIFITLTNIVSKNKQKI